MVPPIGGGREAAELAEGLVEDIRDELSRQTAVAVTDGDRGAGAAEKSFRCAVGRGEIHLPAQCPRTDIDRG